MRNVEPRVNSCCSRLESEPHAHYSGRELTGNDPQQRVNSDNKREPKGRVMRENRKVETQGEEDHHADGSFLECALQKAQRDRKSTRLNSSHGYISYAVFCLKKKKTHTRVMAPIVYHIY